MKRKKYIDHIRDHCRLAVVILLVCTAGHSSAQRYPFHNLSVDAGLMQSQATCMVQDKTGNLWIGTLGGLSRYDGQNFTNYTVRNGLLSNAVWGLAVDQAGNVWVGGQSGISCFDGKSFKHYQRQQQASRVAQQINVVNDTVWWRVQGEVYFITKGKIKYYVSPGAGDSVSSLLAERNGLWIVKRGVVYHKHEQVWDTLRFPLPPDVTPPNVSRIYRDRQGLVWVTTNGGLFRADSSRLIYYPINGWNSDFPPAITSITQDRSDALWLGISGGALKLSGNTTQHYNKRNGLSDNMIFDVLTDAEGNVWLASDGQGIFRFSGTQFTGLDETMGLPSAQVMAIASNNRDSLIIGTYDAGLYIFKDGKVSALSFPSNPVPAITSLCYTRRSKLWIGTRGRGLWSYEREIFRQFEAPDRNFPSNSINCLYEDEIGRLWIGFSNGVMVRENDSFKTIVDRNAQIFSILSLGNDSVLVATESGLLLYNAGSVSSFTTNTIIDSAGVQCFAIQGKYLWLGSAENGLIRYDLRTHKTVVINKSSGLRSDFIYNIVIDNEGYTWVGTGFGIHKIKMDGDVPTVTFYGKAQGITGMESNINSVLKLPDGSIWFGTTNGALHYQPHTAVVSPAPASILLQSVKLQGEATIDPSYYDSTDNWYGIPYNLRLPYKKNNIAFTFQAITLSGAQQVLYRYRMDGLDAPWSDWSATNSVAYSALPPGKYVFHVQCRGAEGQNNTELTYPFEIITPFQKTSWFRYLVLGACILIGIFLQYLVNSRKQRREKLLEKLRAEELSKIRLRTAEDFHDEIGNKLTRINVLTNVLKNKVQMNAETLRILGQIEDNSSQLYSGTRDILWSLKPSNDNLYEILHRIRDFAGELFQDTEVNFTFKGSDEKWRNFRLPMDMSRNLIMIFKEALNNCLKYSKARNVSLEITLKNRNVLQLVLKDDGLGFDVSTVKKGNGMNNMQVRAGRLNGKLYVDSRMDKGTIINLTFKVPQNK